MNTSYYILHDVFTSDEIHTLNTMDLPENEIDDRCVDFVHKVWRIEQNLRQNVPEILKRLKRLIIDAVDRFDVIDEAFGRRFEIEFIRYDCSEHDRLPYIGPHFDNGSLVSLILMLSDESEYEGGILKLQGHDLKLGKGDIVLFRGEKVEHELTEVESGKRQIIQIEFTDEIHIYDAQEVIMKKYLGK